MPWPRYPLPHIAGTKLEESEKLRLAEGNLEPEKKLGENLLKGVEEEEGEEDGGAVRSRVIVGNPSEAEEEEEKCPVLEVSTTVLKCESLCKSAGGVGLGWEAEEAAFSIEMAAEVVDAMAVAVIGSEWLCVPS